MKYALVEGKTVYDVADKPFDVTPNFKWIECPNDIKAHQFTYDGKMFLPISVPQVTQMTNGAQPTTTGVQTL